MGLSVKLDAFEGPLDLLLHLIEKNKVDIYDIPIVSITDQYLSYLSAMENRDMDVMSEFLVMAATLLDIKARMLLPLTEEEEEEDIDPREELVARLLQYKLYKTLSGELKDLQGDAERFMFKDASIPDEVAKFEEPVDIDQLLDGMTLRALNDIFQSVLRKQVDKIDPIRSKFGTIEKEAVRVSDKIHHVLNFASEHKRFNFRELLKAQSTRVEVIVTFLAILELMKIGRVHMDEQTPEGEILLSASDASELSDDELELILQDDQDEELSE